MSEVILVVIAKYVNMVPVDYCTAFPVFFLYR